VTNHSQFAARRIGTSSATADVDSSTRVKFDGLRFQAKDVSFWVRRPGALLFSEERGLLDLNLTGEGLCGDLGLALADEEDDETFFKVKKSSVTLKNLSLKIHDNYHYILSFFLGPLLNAALKLSLQSVLSTQISEAFEFLDWRAFDVRRRALRYETRGYTPGQAYAKALSEPPPSASSGPSALSGLHAGPRGLIRDDRGPHDAQIAIGGEQLLPGKSGPKSSIDRAANKANKLANDTAKDLGLDAKAKKVKANAPDQGDVDKAKKQAKQLRGLVDEEFGNAQDEAESQYRKESSDTWKSDAFNL